MAFIMEKACLSGTRRDDAQSQAIDEIRNLMAELSHAGIPTVVEHEWWKHPHFLRRGNDTKLMTIGNYVFTFDYSSHEAEDEKGLYYTQNMCISKELISTAKEKIAKQVQDIQVRFYGDPYFESMAKRLTEFSGKI